MGAMRVFVLDNYDSFTYNLVQLLERLGAEVQVARNDRVGADEVEALGPDAVVISPGPSRPERAGISVELIRLLGERTPILGVCLGHQAIAVAYGASVVRVEPVHGKRGVVRHEGRGSFAGLATPLYAGRYHSLAIDPATLPPELEATAWSPDGVVMAVLHRSHPVEGLQFHPESILTDDGAALVGAFLARAAAFRERARQPMGVA